ncbi:hypothetical protein HUG17_6401 [Dermatophagoides farinae]|uniref:Uncharacterized protein n=1 Tax=Dermatophagoides farinae TaxID=6954 RepID=A0A9D4P450_DERFA|nr:hypothetical protein HUG17_6401 [Dermatophagoides farinae]
MSKLASFWFWEIRFLLLLLLYVPIAKLQHDTSLSFNNVCITNSDCQNPYSQCNETNGQCECLTEDQINQSLFDYQDDGHSDQNHRKQSVCFHHLIERKFETFINSTHQTMMNWTQVGSDQTKSFDWILATIFAYILPFISITVFLYFIYRSLYRPDEDRDSEMILYQAL